MSCIDQYNAQKAIYLRKIWQANAWLATNFMIIKALLTLALFTILSGLALGQITILKEEQHLAIIKRGQKVFLEKGDYMKDKILKITEKEDTVIVLEADRTYFKFKKDTLIAWSLTAQVDIYKGVITNPTTYEIKMPFSFVMLVDSYAYDQAMLGSNKIIDLKKGKMITVTIRDKGFFKISYNGKTGYVSEADVLPQKTEHPMKRALGLEEVSNSYPSRTTPSKTKSIGRTYFKGPRGGCYYISSSGAKVYVDSSYCN